VSLPQAFGQNGPGGAAALAGERPSQARWQPQLARRARRLQWASLAALALAVEAVARWGWVSPSTLVPATSMVQQLVRWVAGGAIPSAYFARTGSPSLWVHVAATAQAVLWSFLLAVLTGTAVGVAMWRAPGLARAVYPYLLLYYAVPTFALYPLLILLFSSGMAPIVTLGWLFSVAAVVASTYIGLKRVDGEVYVKVGRALGLSSGAMLRWIYLPAAAPMLFAGWKLALTYSIIGVIASEFITSYRGLGYIIDRSYRNFETANMYAGILLVLLCSLGVLAALNRLERRIHRLGGQRR